MSTPAHLKVAYPHTIYSESFLNHEVISLSTNVPESEYFDPNPQGSGLVLVSDEERYSVYAINKREIARMHRYAEVRQNSRLDSIFKRILLLTVLIVAAMTGLVCLMLITLGYEGTDLFGLIVGSVLSLAALVFLPRAFKNFAVLPGNPETLADLTEHLPSGRRLNLSAIQLADIGHFATEVEVNRLADPETSTSYLIQLAVTCGERELRYASGEAAETAETAD